MFVDTVVNSMYQFMGEGIDRLIGAAEGWRDKYVVELVLGATACPALANCVASDAATRKADRRFDGWHFMSDRLKYWGELGDRRL